jgi:phosphoribulokinase
MSTRHPVVAITGSSGGRHTSVTRSFSKHLPAREADGGDDRGRLLPPVTPAPP